MDATEVKDTDKARILLVDDTPANLTALAAILEPLGHTLVTARSGREALKHLLLGDFAVILLDVQMPDLDGFETAQLINRREKSRNIPLIFVTAINNEDSFLTRAYAAGAVDFLRKPYHPDVLKSKVSVFVDMYHQREQIRKQAEALRLAERRQTELQQAIREREQERRHLEELARRESEKAALSRHIETMARRQRVFLRDILFSLTEGRLHLCESRDELPERMPAFADTMELTSGKIRYLREQISAVAEEAGWAADRTHLLVTAAAEAAMNAVVHGDNARGSVCLDRATGAVQVWIEDDGNGISEEDLHRATLERGYTTTGTLGHGFWLMLQTTDRVYLQTGPAGTTVVLEQDRTAPLPSWIRGRGPAEKAPGEKAPGEQTLEEQPEESPVAADLGGRRLVPWGNTRRAPRPGSRRVATEE